ncbi:MAG: hypothetical protein K9J16_13990 [Melioribacteraceae bacterium]|nr:hypothetical protein [Melioribacteraceae bacterium]MCF8356344.1 hypothetical protein [Melioribacteraceae bacterium]MCF8395753.1 hypothetical protein [Melioribacteraceae bacterium]
MFPQETYTKSSSINLVYCDVKFLKEIGTNINSSEQRKVRSNAGRQSNYNVYRVKISANIIEINENTTGTLNVKLTSPKGYSQYFRLADDISNWNVNQVYEYHINFKTHEIGWYKMELGKFNIRDKNNKYDIIYDKRGVYFGG